MGLDMYLYRMPKFKNTTPKEMIAINNYFDWKRSKEEGSKYANCTLKEWCGISENDLNGEAIEFYKSFFTKKYYSFDVEQQFGRKMIMESIADWRKANAIHNWFVENVQNGEDDCGYYEVSQKQLEHLLSICQLIKDQCCLKKGRIVNGYTYDDNCVEQPVFEEGEYIENYEIAEKYLPTVDGFFFGSTDYDQWYMQDIEYTIQILTRVLESTDFDTQMIIYVSSW